jgi:hypothetical protein
MTPDQFLAHINVTLLYSSDRPLIRKRRARAAYRYYVDAYRAKTITDLFDLIRAAGGANYKAVRKACQQRDAGEAMFVVPEFMNDPALRAA